MFLSLDLLSEYRIQHGAIGPLYVNLDILDMQLYMSWYIMSFFGFIFTS